MMWWFTVPAGLTIVTFNRCSPSQLAVMVPTVPSADEHEAAEAVIVPAFIMPSVKLVPFIKMASTLPAAGPHVKHAEAALLFIACAVVSNAVQQTRSTVMVLAAFRTNEPREALSMTSIFRLLRPFNKPEQLTCRCPMGAPAAAGSVCAVTQNVNSECTHDGEGDSVQVKTTRQKMSRMSVTQLSVACAERGCQTRLTDCCIHQESLHWGMSPSCMHRRLYVLPAPRTMFAHVSCLPESCQNHLANVNLTQLVELAISTAAATSVCSRTNNNKKSTVECISSNCCICAVGQQHQDTTHRMFEMHTNVILSGASDVDVVAALIHKARG